jgi:hypothetical protein
MSDITFYPATIYEKELYADMKKLCQLFNETWPNRQILDSAKFYGLATACQTLRNKKSENRLSGGKTVTTPLETAAKKFCKELELELTRLESKDDIEREMMKYTGDAGFLELIRQAETLTREIIGCLRVTNPNPAIYLLKEVQFLWPEGSKKAPRPSKPDSPICKFITSALAICNINFSEKTVDGFLRGRADRHRSGKER